MDLHAIPDSALEGGRRPVGDFGGWLSSYVFGAELVLALGRDLAAMVRNSVLPRALRSGAARIRVPPVSDTWLRMHATDDGKHHGEL